MSWVTVYQNYCMYAKNVVGPLVGPRRSEPHTFLQAKKHTYRGAYSEGLIASKNSSFKLLITSCSKTRDSFGAIDG